MGVFTEGGADLTDVEACVELLRDERLRAEFQVKLKAFLAVLDFVLPRPEGLPYVHDARTLSYIQVRARLRYRGSEAPIGREVGAKIRRLIDQHVRSEGIEPTVAPLLLTDEAFLDHARSQPSDRAVASEMEHALRHHIRAHREEDPVAYDTLSERLERIVTDLDGRWEQQALAFEERKSSPYPVSTPCILS